MGSDNGDRQTDGPAPPLPTITTSERLADLGRAAIRMTGTLALLGLLTWVLVGSQEPLPVGSPAPPLQGALGLDGGPWELRPPAGRPAVVNLWATWCPPCLSELPAFAAVSERHPDVAFYGVAVDSPRAQVARTVERMKIPYSIALVESAGVQAWNATALPSTIIFDGNGKVAWSIRGAIDAALLEEKLAPLIGPAVSQR